MNKKVKLGFLPAKRGCFDAVSAGVMRKQTVAALQKLGVNFVAPDEHRTEQGCVTTLEEAQYVAELFRRENVAGILLGAMNFGEESAVAHTIKKAAPDIPVLVFGAQEDETLTMNTVRRDSFCGLLSLCDALRQVGVKYSVAKTPVGFPEEDSFAADVDWFERVCRVVDGVRNARYAQIGTRPDCFWTCRYNEKKLQKLGPTAVVCDLSEAFAEAKRIPDDNHDYLKLLEETKRYADCSQCEPRAIEHSAKLELFLRRFQQRHQIDGFAIQCWASIQQNYGCSSCTAMSRLGNEGIPCACESDILGTLSMHAAMLSSGTPAGLADWNNLHNEDAELATIWHCGVFPGSFAKTPIRLGGLGVDGAKAGDTHGTVHFVSKSGPVTLFRVTQDVDSNWHAVVVEAAFEDNAAETFGCYGWCRIANLQSLYRNILLQHFPHHVGVVREHCGNILWEAFGNYFGMKMYHSAQSVPGLYTPLLPF
jgi:L-fucose isomerase-like protein